MNQPPGPAAPANEVTRDRLLDASAACFAARGYAGTSVRDITARAGCNVSALTYHFGGKKKAYVAVFEDRLRALAQRRVSAMRNLLASGVPELEQVVRTFATAFLEPLQDSERGRETMLLLLREMVDGHLPANLVAERMVYPTVGALAEAIQRACPGLPPEQLPLCCHSLIAQLVHVLQVQRMQERGRFGKQPPFRIQDTVSHIVRFSCAGVRASCVEPGP